MAIERILIVDEAEPNLLFFEVTLKELGQFSVTTAGTGAAALDYVEKLNIQFVIAAWEMTTMPGTVLVQRVREMAKKKHLPYLIYSKRLSDEDLALVKDLGLGNILTLPLDRDKAKEAIKTVLDYESALPSEDVKLRKIENYIADNRPTEALKMFDNSLRKKGAFFPRASACMGDVWMMTNQLDKAEKCFLEALAADPAYTEASQRLAQLYSRTGRHEQAIATLQKMAESSPQNLSTVLGLGSAYVEAERFDEAKEVFGKVADIDPDVPKLKDERGKLAFREGDMTLAAQLLSETQNGANLARYFNNLAIALTHRQEFDKAVETYEKAIQVLGNRAKTHILHYNLGLAFSKKGDLQKAFVELATSYKGDPSFEKAYAALARLAKEMGEKRIGYDKALVVEVNKARQEFKAQQAKASQEGEGSSQQAGARQVEKSRTAKPAA